MDSGDIYRRCPKNLNVNTLRVILFKDSFRREYGLSPARLLH